MILDENFKDFEVAVKTALIKKRITMSEISSQLQITPAYVSDIIRGNRKAEHYRKKICEILNLNYEER